MIIFSSFDSSFPSIYPKVMVKGLWWRVNLIGAFSSGEWTVTSDPSMVTSGLRKCISPPIAARQSTSHKFPSLFSAVTSTRRVQHFSPERTHSSSISTHRLKITGHFRSRNIFKRKSSIWNSSGKASHYVGFICIAFHGRISNGTSGS